LELVLERLPFHGDSLEMALEVEHVELMERESGSPVVSAVPGVEGLFVALGLGERGVELAPGLAEGLCQMIEGQPVAAFDPAVMDLGAL
jgi:glycine/D-amino acid oxidase-like deaminating enzyme